MSISFATALRIANSLLNVSTFPQNLSDTGVFADLTDLSPAPGLLPYSVNVPSWSDFAIKRHWFIVPDGLGDFTYNHDGAWGVPDGTVWVQHFDLDLTRGNPATRRRVETRLLVKNPAGISGVSYRWNDAQTGATLAPDAGVDIPFNVIESGVPRVQTWRIPSRAECTACHTSQAGFALSFTTRQLNLAGDMNGFSGNQIGLLEAHGFLTNSADSPNLLPRHVRPDENAYSIEARVRSYLDVNCANCHRPGGTAAPSVWDGRVQVILAQTGLLNVSPVNNLGNTLNKLIVPADIAHSVVLSRMAASNGFTRMPPLASNELDATDIALVTNWISNSLPSRQSYDQWRQQYFGNTTSLAGAPTADPDGDGVTNQNEFLTGTNPVQSASAMRLNPVRVGGTTTFQFNVPENRSFLVEESTNLATWQPMNIPGNDGVPRPAGPVAITAPITGARAFYRVRFWEN